MPEPKPQPQVAFIAAALALLVIPVLVIVGLSALGVAAGLFAPVDRVLNGRAGWLFLAVLGAWVVLVTGAVLMLIARLTRRRTRV